MREQYSQRQSGSAVNINLTPLIDMVFILLIFFIVTTSFVKETGVEVNRPSAETAVRKERSNILIAIRANDEIWMDQRQIDIRAVRANVERLYAENPEGAVVIVADEDSKTGLVINVMDQARLAGVTDVSIAAAKDQ
ncbi:ExbD/TolR family protein [Nitrosococcus oceani]|uniref:Outer membrane transport energization protein ExbD n=2 Tax=Nitrosococcus oceani TaxID=1229 RepID=Q3JDG8_NITOC|nr:biopolymer transporter ExbD [Nitrosococcus oceani]KFI20389.1 biopolymer transporter ExbD [Nitrosococcus oceani C-27]ABA57128.1 outer membrane transport energization protein ExbD [Nitrosococcus oceani ATCC 19707]EDZ65692.1 transport energizing protein, ExbD/TolR family [Nitrosococcus oceani AFC27]KFI23539.1 biopolymer transporter ExbD [Nitrosococcus oceani]GEM19852.1 biopolymer transporter ExbD [Nitrosococcus oceani]